jgi:hypothetical protein
MPPEEFFKNRLPLCLFIFNKKNINIEKYIEESNSWPLDLEKLRKDIAYTFDLEVEDFICLYEEIQLAIYRSWLDE